MQISSRQLAEFYYLSLRKEALTYVRHVPEQGHRAANMATTNLLQNLFFAICEQLQIKRFFELGAHEATASRVLKSKIPSLQVYAVEANPYTHARFKDDFKEINGFSYIHAAVSAQHPTTTLEIPLFDDSPHNLMPGNASINKRKGAFAPNTYHSVEVSTVSVDSMLKDSTPADSSAALWIDLEGSALQALNTCSDFSCIEVIYTELEDEQYWENQGLAIDVIEALLIGGFVPFAFDCEYPNQYNGLFIKSSRLQWLFAFEAAVRYLEFRRQISTFV